MKIDITTLQANIKNKNSFIADLHLSKKYLKTIVRIDNDYENPFAFDDLKESLIYNLNNLQNKTDNGILYIENKNNDYRNILADTGHSYYGTTLTGIMLDKGTEKERELIILENDKDDELLIKYGIDKLEFNIKGYSQGEWDTYEIYFDNKKTSEGEIKEALERLKYIFTVSALNVEVRRQYKYTLKENKLSDNILLETIETDDNGEDELEDGFFTHYLNGDEDDTKVLYEILQNVIEKDKNKIEIIGNYIK